MSGIIQQYYDSLAGRYDALRFSNKYGQYLERFERKYLNRWVKKTSHTLDLGCGTGRLSDFASAGLDFSPKMIELSKQKHPQKVFYLSEASQIPFQSSSLNTVFSIHFLMHQNKESIQSIFQEVYRVLKPQGYFVFDIPSFFRKQKKVNEENPWHCNTTFTLKEIKKLLKPNFELINISGIMLFPIHRISLLMAKILFPLDYLANQTFLKYFSSYYFVVARKNP